MGNTSSTKKKKKIRVFISYRRDKGSPIARLLKEDLSKNEEFDVFLDVENLEAGRFDHALDETVKGSDHFVLVLTQGALDRCIEDKKRNVCEDWVHKEIKTALENGLNIIPILHPDFNYPPDEDLPEDMRNIGLFNAVPWSHYFKNAAVDVIERFIRGFRRAKNQDVDNDLAKQYVEKDLAIIRQIHWIQHNLDLMRNHPRHHLL